MHDIDRTGGFAPEYNLYETGDSFESPDVQEVLDSLESEPFEFGGGQFGFETADMGMSAEVAFNDNEEAALAGELLGVSNDEELDYFLGSLIKKAAGAAGKFISSPAGKALGGMLKGLAKKALPVLGTAAGGFFGGPLGASIGGKLASGLGNALQLEVEGLSAEDRDFEIAKGLVRFAGSAARAAAQAPANAAPGAIARSAIANAARTHAPGLFRWVKSVVNAPPLSAYGPRPGFPPPIPRPPYGPMPGPGPRPYQATGRWYRRGNRIVLVGI